LCLFWQNINIVIVLDSITLILIALGLSMDCFAVSVSNGCAQLSPKPLEGLKTSIVFGLAHFIMIFAGYHLGHTFESHIKNFDHWIAFLILAIIGGKMIAESFGRQEEKTFNLNKPLVVLMLAVATSIDALAVGMSLGLLDISVYRAAIIIALFAFAVSFTGMFAGRMFGSKIRNKAELAGGIILVGIGIKILLEHSFFSS